MTNIEKIKWLFEVENMAIFATVLSEMFGARQIIIYTKLKTFEAGNYYPNPPRWLTVYQLCSSSPPPPE